MPAAKNTDQTTNNTPQANAASGFKNRFIREFLDIRCMDCMELMAKYPDKHFDLAIVDPPYGIGVNSMNMGSRKTVRPDARNWDDEIPPPEYFVKLFRVSKRQIVWGGNYFALPPSRGWVVWDKGESMYGRSFAEVELAWTSMDVSSRIFKMSPNQPNRFHPTQKPVELYKWLLNTFAKPDDRILDTHLGSGSIAIACHYARLHLTASEIDQDYFKAACARIERETAQTEFYLQNTPITTPKHQT